MVEKHLIIKLAIEKGRILKDFFPELKDFYSATISINRQRFPLHFSIREISEICWSDYYLMEKTGIRNFGLLENSIRYALVGNKNESAGEVYSGLLSEEEYSKISKMNRVNSGIMTSERAKEQKKGALYQTKEQLSEAAKKSAIARGKIPWTEQEINYAFYLRWQGLTSSQIAKTFGRTKYSVQEMFRRELRKKEKQDRYYTD